MLNAAEYLYTTIGLDLTDLLFRPYTRKMRTRDLEDMSADVVKRIPLRFDRKESYFSEEDAQIMPRDGYTAIFQAIFHHPNIAIALQTPFERSMLKDYDFCFNAMPIDEYFGYTLGHLPYRSLKFNHKTVQGMPDRSWSITNFTDSGPFTRETAWHNHAPSRGPKYWPAHADLGRPLRLPGQPVGAPLSGQKCRRPVQQTVPRLSRTIARWPHTTPG